MRLAAERPDVLTQHPDVDQSLAGRNLVPDTEIVATRVVV
jgi:hypothetical protein